MSDSEDFEQELSESEPEELSDDFASESEDEGRKKKKKTTSKKSATKKTASPKKAAAKSPKGSKAKPASEAKSPAMTKSPTKSHTPAGGPGYSSSTSGASAVTGVKRKEMTTSTSTSSSSVPSSFSSSSSSAGPAAAAAAKKGKVKELTGQAAENEVLRYMTEQNRPYALLQIFENLHEAVKKAHLQKILDQFADEGKLVGKLYGKAKIYHLNQEGLSAADPSVTQALDEKIAALSSKIAELKPEQAALQHSCNLLEAAPTLEEALSKHAKLKKENDEKEARLQVLAKEAGAIKTADLDKIKNKFMFNLKEWRRRRRACDEMMDMYLDNVTKTKKAFIKEMGIETDEEYKVDLKAMLQFADDVGCKLK